MEINRIDADLLVKMFKQGTANLTKHKEVIDALNVFPVPDGDTGTNMSLTMNYAVTEMLKQDYLSVDEVAKAMSKGSLMGARGNSGVILSQIFRGFAKGCEGHETLGTQELAQALMQSAKTAYKAVLKPVEGTILTVIREIAEFSEGEDKQVLSLHAFIEAVLVQGEKTLKKTPDLLPQLKQAGVVDAGGKGLMIILMGFYEALIGKESEDMVFDLSGGPDLPAQASINPDDIHFTYCTEFIVKGADLTDADLKSKIIDMGDSMVYVPDDDIIKVHIHTNDPGLVMQEALKFGELVKIKIENMKEQHGSILNDHQGAKAPKKPYGFIAVAMGEGLAEVYRDLKVDHIIEGGQTMNPSTEDIKKAIDKVNADHVFILPNNSNIILAANQAKDLSDTAVHVLPTKTVLQGISAMLAFDPHHGAESNFDAMVDAIGQVKSLQVTYAVRDTVVNDITIKTDDFLSILDNQIVASGQDKVATIMSGLEKAVDDYSEIVTVYYGQDISEEEAGQLVDLIESTYEDLEVEMYAGKQPIYYYLISVE